MARICTICGKGANTANSRSKSNIASKRRQGVNLQKMKVGNYTILACTRCVRTTAKQNA